MSRLVPRPVLVVLTLALIACSAARGQHVVGDDDLLDKARARGLHAAHHTEPAPLKRAAPRRGADGLRRSGGANSGRDTDSRRFVEPLAKTAGRRTCPRGRPRRSPRRPLALLGRAPRFRGVDADAPRGGHQAIYLRGLLGGSDGAAAGGVAPGRGTRRRGQAVAWDLSRRPRRPGPVGNQGDCAETNSRPCGQHRRQQLARAARGACAREYEERSQRIRDGKDTPDILLANANRRLAVERAASEGPAEFLAVLEGHWLMIWLGEQLARERVEAGIPGFTWADSYKTSAARLEAGVMIAAARRRADKPLPLRGGLQDRFGAVDNRLDLRRMRGPSSRPHEPTSVNSIAERRDVPRRVFDSHPAAKDSRSRQRSSRRLLDPELDLADGKKAERLAALERHWARAAEIEGWVRGMFEHGVRYSWEDFWEARYERIQAELWIAEARAARE